MGPLPSFFAFEGPYLQLHITKNLKIAEHVGTDVSQNPTKFRVKPKEERSYGNLKY